MPALFAHQPEAFCYGQHAWLKGTHHRLTRQTELFLVIFALFSLEWRQFIPMEKQWSSDSETLRGRLQGEGRWKETTLHLLLVSYYNIMSWTTLAVGVMVLFYWFWKMIISDICHRVVSSSSFDMSSVVHSDLGSNSFVETTDSICKL